MSIKYKEISAIYESILLIEFNEDYIKYFNKTGFLRIKNFFYIRDIELIKQDLDNICFKAKDKFSNIPVRCYKDTPYFISKGVNVASIEDPYFYLSSKSVKTLQKYNIANIVGKLIKKKKMSISLSRVHVTGFFKYEGPWHRDQDLNTKDMDVLCNIYLMDERGMKFFPKHHPIHKNSSFSFDDKIVSADYNTLEANAGDLIFLDPKLIHKPFSVNKRMHLHSRFSSSFSSHKDESTYRNYNLFYQRDLGFLSSVKRFKNLIVK